MSKNLTLIITIALSGIAVFASYLINFFLTPFITDNIGIDAYGYFTLAKTIVNYASIITVGFTAFMIRFISIEYFKKNFKNASEYYSTSILSVIIVSIIIIFISLICIAYIDKLLVIPKELVSSVKILFVLVTINFCITNLSIPFSAIFYIKDKLIWYNFIKIISYLVEAVALIILFSTLSANVLLIGIGLICSSLTIFIGNFIFSAVYLKNTLKFNFHYVSIKKIGKLTKNGVWQSVNSLGSTLNSGLDLLVANNMLNPLISGQLSIVKTLGSMFSILYPTISQAFQPRMLKKFSLNDANVFLKELIFSMRVCGFFGSCGLAGFISLGFIYYKLWLPNEDTYFLYYLTLVTVLPSVFEGLIYPTYFVNTLTIKKIFPCFVTFANGIINFASMYFLIKYTNLGVNVIVWSTAILSFITNGIINPVYCSRILNLKWYTLFPTMIKHIITTVMMIGCFIGIEKMFNPKNWIELILVAVLSAILGALIYFIFMTTINEKKYIFNMIKDKFIKIGK